MVETYAEAGVDLDEKSRQVAALVSALSYKRKGPGRPLGTIGAFTGLVEFGDRVLSLCTDSVGTKILVAEALNRWDTIGIDCIAMNVNDMITAGGEPVAFVDYVPISKYDVEIAPPIGVGLNRGAELAKLTIIGGEVAVVPELVRGDDLAGEGVGGGAETAGVEGKRVPTRGAISGVAR